MSVERFDAPAWTKPCRKFWLWVSDSLGWGATMSEDVSVTRDSPAVSQSYPSRRSDVHGQNVVATSQPLAAQAGLAVLREGGNAVDAALATAITLTVVEPTMNGIGSDAFAIVADAGGGIHGFNGSGRSPAGWSPERFADR